MSEPPVTIVQDTTASTTDGPKTTTSGLTATNQDSKATETPVLGPGEGKPSDNGAVEALPNVTNAPKEENVGKNEVLVESQPINEGVLNYKGPGLKGLIFSKKYFWFSDAPLEHKHLSAYLSNEKAKDIAHGNAAHATQTGKGLLFYAKRVEDKDHPQGILNLADVTEIAKGNVNDFTVSLHGHKHTFQALSKAERDGWLVAIEPKMTDAKTSREGIVGSEGYKSQLEKYGKPAAAAAGTTGISRSLSRPKKASKSRERVKDATGTKDSIPAKDVKPAATTETTPPVTSATGGAATEGATPTDTEKGISGEHPTEAVAGTPSGIAAVGASTPKGSTSDEEKKAKKSEKSRSQSRNKRGSIFGNLLAKKEENDEKRAAKKAEKEEKKEEKAEEKAVKQEVKKEEKAEKKAEKEEEKAEHEAEKQIEKETKPEGTVKAGDFDAAAVASRVVGAPVVPATDATTGATETTPASGTEPVAATGATPTTSPTGTTSSKPTKRNSVFGGLFGKKETTTSPTTTETSPAVPAKNEPAVVSPTAPQLDNPVVSSATDTTTPAAATKTDPTSAAEPTAPASPTSFTNKRRTSFFSNLGTKKEKKIGPAPSDEVAEGDAKKQGSGGFSGLLRKASRAQPKKDSNAPVTDPAEVPMPKETPAGDKAVANGEPTASRNGDKAEHKPDLTQGQVAPNAIGKNEESKAVEATA